MGIVTILVQDQDAHVQKEFTCELGVLRKGMGLFQSMLCNVGPGQDVRLVVQSDVQVGDRHEAHTLAHHMVHAGGTCKGRMRMRAPCET